MKTILARLLLIVFSILSLSLIFTACGGDNENPTHSHSFGEWRTTKTASCTEDGEEVRFCDCGEKQTNAIGALRHSYKDGICERCGNVNGDGSGNGDNGSGGDTSGGGGEDHIHTRGTPVKENEVKSTCDENGSYDEVVYCADCNHELTREKKYLPISGHNYNNYVCTKCKKEVVPSEGLEFSSSKNGTCYVIGMGTCFDTSIVVPTFSPSGDKVIGLSEGCSIITNTDPVSILLPEGLTSIGAYVNFGNSIESIEVDAKNTAYKSRNGNLYTKDGTTLILYASGKKDTDFIVPDGVTTIYYEAFSGSSNLKNITIPYSVTSIRERAFEYCSSLENITVSETNDYFRSIDGNLYSKDGKKLIQYALGKANDTFETPDSVRSIEKKAFYGCNKLKNVVIGDSVTNIGEEAFSYCESITNVVIGDSVTTIGNQAFSNCTSLASVIVPDSVTSIGYNAFSGCSSLVSISIGSSVTDIGGSAFLNCESLYKIINKSNLAFDFGSSDYGAIAEFAKIIVDKDGNKTYNNTESTEYLETEDGFLFEIKEDNYTLIAYLGEEDTVTLPTDIGGNKYEIYYMRGCKNVIIPDGTTSIGDCTFYYCSSLVGVVIPDSVTSIGDSAFGNCSNLASITVEKGNAYYKSEDGNLYSKDGKTLIQYAIAKTDESFIIPNGVTSIGENAFTACTFLTNIVIPNSVTSIGEAAFSGCTSLTSIAIPNSVTSISDVAFYFCISLKSVVIPDSVTSIGFSAFLCCASLKSIVIPDSVTNIYSDAFFWCYALDDVYYTGTEEEWNSISIDSTNNSDLTNATRYYYSEGAPTADGNFWHYDADGNVAIWEK